MIELFLVMYLFVNGTWQQASSVPVTALPQAEDICLDYAAIFKFDFAVKSTPETFKQLEIQSADDIAFTCEYHTMKDLPKNTFMYKLTPLKKAPE